MHPLFQTDEFDKLFEEFLIVFGENLEQRIDRKLESLFKLHYEHLNKQYESIDRLLTLISNDLGSDRKDISFMKVNQETLIQLLRELLDTNNRQTRQITNKVDGRMGEVEKNMVETASRIIPEKAREAMQNYIEVTQPKVIGPLKKTRQNIAKALFNWILRRKGGGTHEEEKSINASFYGRILSRKNKGRQSRSHRSKNSVERSIDNI